MAENSNPEQKKELSPKQHGLIAALMAGNTIQVAAKISGVGERTAHTWLKQPLFKQAYEDAKQTAFNETLETLRKGTSIALKTLLKHMTDENTAPYVQVQAASKWLDMSFEVHKSSELEIKISEIEELVKGKNE